MATAHDPSMDKFIQWRQQIDDAIADSTGFCAIEIVSITELDEMYESGKTSEQAIEEIYKVYQLELTR